MERKWGLFLATSFWVLTAIPAPTHAQSIEFGKAGTPDFKVTNPVKDIVPLQFSLKYSGPVNLSVYDVRGRFVAKLVDGPMAAGTHVVRWNQAGAAGHGVYFARLRTSQGDQTLKVLVLGR
jgi:hypothetical protein